MVSFSCSFSEIFLVNKFLIVGIKILIMFKEK